MSSLNFVDVSFMLSTLVDLLELFIVGMVTSKVGKRFAFKGLKALSEIFIRHVFVTLTLPPCL